MLATIFKGRRSTGYNIEDIIRIIHDEMVYCINASRCFCETPVGETCSIQLTRFIHRSRKLQAVMQFPHLIMNNAG